MTPAQIEYKRKQRAERTVNGICTRCGRERATTKVLCQSCREYVNTHRKRQKIKAKARERMRKLRAARKSSVGK